MPFIEVQTTAIKKQLTTSYPNFNSFLDHEGYKPIKQLGDVCHIRRPITVDRTEFLLVPTNQFPVGLLHSQGHTCYQNGGEGSSIP